MAAVKPIEFPWKAIGYVRSPYTFKNGTPRQATVCQQSKGMITVEKSVFNNPEHSLEGLQQFTHIWIVFVFHKNNNQYSKAKVKPPRLNGGKVGLFSTRSPYRPNNIGLTLAKIESIQGATVCVSGIDILDGTPVLDIKPYIPQYDCPGLASVDPRSAPCTQDRHISSTESRISSDGYSANIDKDVYNINRFQESLNIYDENVVSSSNRDEGLTSPITSQSAENGTIRSPSFGHSATNTDRSELTTVKDGVAMVLQEFKPIAGTLHMCVSNKCDKELTSVQNEKVTNLCHTPHSETSDPWVNGFEKCSQNITHNKNINLQDSKSKQKETGPIVGEVSSTDSGKSILSTAADWITRPPISTLNVRFTSRSLTQLSKFSHMSDNQRYKLQFLKSPEEARQAIINILHEDPRSVYRRNQCVDSLYYFTLDVIHVTCWFDTDGDQEAAEVVRVKSAYDAGSHGLTA